MRRPVCLIAASFAAGIFFGFHMEMKNFIFLALACLAPVLPVMKISGYEILKKTLCLILIFFLSGGACFFIQFYKKDGITPLAGTYTTIEGMVCSVQKKDDEHYRMTVKSEGTKVLVNIYGDFEAAGVTEKLGDLAGRHVSVSGMPELASERRNPHMFDYRLYLRAKGVNAVMDVKPFDVELSGGKVDIFVNTVSNIRHDFTGRAAEVMEPAGTGILLGMLFGDKNSMDDDIYEMFQKNGTAHILAVSGIHVGIIYLVLSKLIRAGRNPFLNILLLLLLFLYAALASFAPSVLRAGGMIALHIVAKIFCLRYDMMCAGAGMAFIMMFFNPLVIFDMGFQLSFLAIFILAAAVPAVLKVHNNNITAVFALQGGLAPITAYMFNYFSLAAFFINIPVVFLAGVIVPFGLFLVPLSYVSAPLFSICAGVTDGLCMIMYKMNEFTYAKGGFFWNVVSPPLAALFIFYGLLFFCCSETAWLLWKRKKRKITLMAGATIILISVLAAVPFQDGFNKAQLIFVDVGQGDCLHIKTPGGKNILIDGGGSMNYDVGKKILKPYLLKNGVSKVDMIFVSHRHLDHYGGIVSLANSFNVGKLALYEANNAIEDEILAETGLDREQIVYLTQGQSITLDRDVCIEVLYPGRKTAEEYRLLAAEGADENYISLIMKVKYLGFSVLMTGDINFEGESRLIEAAGEGRLKSDVLKVAHHGSKYSSSEEFLAAVSPTAAVFQVGKNGFGHPTPEVLEKCGNIGADIYRNDEQGAIAVFLKKSDPLIRTAID